jgi:putative transposase
MGKKHFSEEQIAFALRQAESGTLVAEIIRKLGISEQTFYRWKKRFAGLGIAELRRLRTLEEENRKLKQLLADRRRRRVGLGAGDFASRQAAHYSSR